MVERKPLVWMHGEVQTPPFSREARIEAGTLIRHLQEGENISLPHARPMPNIGQRCLELRINDENITWRIICHIAKDAVVILEVFDKKTNRTPKKVLDTCKARLKRFYS